MDVHARGRSPGLRVAALARLPKAFAPQWLCRTNARRLQLRGQLRIDAAIMVAPDSRLSLQFCESKEPRTLDIVDKVKIASITMIGYQRFHVERGAFRLARTVTPMISAGLQRFRKPSHLRKITPPGTVMPDHMAAGCCFDFRCCEGVAWDRASTGEALGPLNCCPRKACLCMSNSATGARFPEHSAYGRVGFSAIRSMSVVVKDADAERMRRR